MKQLKFMLAAATAISLATAAQADTTQFDKSEIDSENFDSVTTLNDTAAVMALKGFSYEGTENDSVVVAGGAKGTANALEVNTGTDPLLRKIDTDTNNAVTLDSTGAKKVYIDTMVQFTVTPFGDTVSSNGVNDKLMIYLKEMTNGVGEVTGTNLMVKAAKYQQGDEWEGIPESFAETDVSVSAADLTVTTNTWYSLEVVASVDNGVPVFSISINGKQLTSDVILYGTDGTKFPSLMGKQTDSEGNLVATLDKVGFAGEGMVDELAFYHDVEQETNVDFTYTIKLEEGVSSVTYTIGGESVKITEETAVPDLAKDTEIVVTAEAKDWYKITAGTGTYTVTADETIMVKAEKTANVDADGNVAVAAGTKPTDVYVTGGAFASTANDAAVAELNKALTWAKRVAGKTTAAEAGALVSGLNFAEGEEETDAEKAYLFNCTIGNVANEVANFKFPAITPGTKPSVNAPLHGGQYNGQLKYYGADTIDGLAAEVEATDAHKFFKAVLVK